MKNLGFLAAGYNYVNIDDCWLTKSRTADGHLIPDPTRFPNGMKKVADYLHNLGFKAGVGPRFKLLTSIS